MCKILPQPLNPASYAGGFGTFGIQKYKDVQTVDKTVENLLIIGKNNSQSVGTEQFPVVDNFDAVGGSL